MQSKRYFAPLTALLTAIMLLLAPLQLPLLKVEAANEATIFSYPVTGGAYENFSGDFLYKDGKIYIEHLSLLGTASIYHSYHLDDPELFCTLTCGDAEWVIKDEEVISYLGGSYIPLEEVLSRFDLNSALIDGALTITQGADLSNLPEQLRLIHSTSDYDMAYWKNMQEYEDDRAKVFAADIIRGGPITIAGYLGGGAQLLQYKDALWKILLPQDDEDIEAVTDFGEMFDFMADTSGLFADLAEGAGYLPDDCYLAAFAPLFETVDAVWDYGQVEEIVKLTTFTRQQQNLENSLINGIEIINSHYAKSYNKHLSHGLELMLNLHHEQVPAWQKMLVTVTAEGAKDAAQAIDLGLSGWKKAFVKACQETLGEVLEKSSGESTVMMMRCTEIQRACSQVYFEERLIWADPTKPLSIRQASLRRMHSLTLLYLRAGVEANREMLGSDDHADQAKTLIASLNREIAQLQQYDPVEFTTVDQAARTENQLIDLVRSGDFEVVDLDAIPEPEPIPWEQPTFLYLTWDPNGGGEEGRMLEMYVTGYLDAGGALTGPDDDGFLWAEDGTKAAQLFSLPETDGALVLEIYEPDGIYDIEISNGYEWATAGLPLWSANPVIEFQPMGGERVVLADVGNEYYGDYYWRAPTGIHLFTFSIDHEEIKPLYW